LTSARESKRFADPRQAEANMKTAKMADGKPKFSVNQLLNHRQIASFFSRLSSKSHRPKRDSLVEEDINDNEVLPN
jgi:hypothetical protein